MIGVAYHLQTSLTASVQRANQGKCGLGQPGDAEWAIGVCHTVFEMCGKVRISIQAANSPLGHRLSLTAGFS
jgi:hypothetical protein